MTPFVNNEQRSLVTIKIWSGCKWLSRRWRMSKWRRQNRFQTASVGAFTRFFFILWQTRRDRQASFSVMGSLNALCRLAVSFGVAPLGVRDRGCQLSASTTAARIQRPALWRLVSSRQNYFYSMQGCRPIPGTTLKVKRLAVSIRSDRAHPSPFRVLTSWYRSCKRSRSRMASILFRLFLKECRRLQGKYPPNTSLIEVWKINEGPLLVNLHWKKKFSLRRFTFVPKPYLQNFCDTFCINVRRAMRNCHWKGKSPKASH